jgi:hypothetical protein
LDLLSLAQATASAISASVNSSSIQFGPHCVPALNAHGREDDLPGSGLYVKVFRGTHGLRHALGQRELVFGSDFGKHGVWQKVRIHYFSHGMQSCPALLLL